jgi:hypothetical protein
MACLAIVHALAFYFSAGTVPAAVHHSGREFVLVHQTLLA